MGQALFDQLQRVSVLILVRRVIFGNGSASKVGDEVKAIGARKVLLVTDPGVVKSGVFEGVNASLEAKGLHADIFSQVEPEPDIETARNVTRIARAHEFDVVCGIGGGSAMDIAKIAAVMATNPPQ
jgi:alcohol dehydrogenase class IV